MPQNLPPPGWYRDPTGMADARYWNGTTWTLTVSRQGVALNLPIDQSIAAVPPMAGSEVRMFTPTPNPATPSVSVTTGGDRSPAAAIMGALAVVLLVVLLVVVISNSDSSSDTPVPATNPPAEAPPPDQPTDDPPADDG